MARVQIPISFQYVVGSNLQPVVGATVTIVNRNTLSPATVWSGFTGGGTIATVVTDSVGNVPGYLDEGSYTITAGTAGGFGGAALNWEATRGDGVANIGAGAVTPSALAAAVAQAIHQPGDLKFSAVTVAPTGWLLADGSQQSRSGATGPLFAAIGTTYGVGNGTTTFNLPTMLGRLPIGAGASSATRGSTWALGNQPTSGPGGEESHAQAVTEMANHNHGGATGVGSTGTGVSGNENQAHNHTGTTDVEGQGFTHNYSGATDQPTWEGNQGFNVWSPGGGADFVAITWGATFVGANAQKYSDYAHVHTYSGTTGTQNENHTHTFTSNTEGQAHNHNVPSLSVPSLSISPQGNGNPANIVPPVSVGRWFIKM